MWSPPAAPTSYPGSAEVRDKEGPKTYVDSDFPWLEDPLSVWRTVGLYGGLVFAEGIALRLILTDLSVEYPGITLFVVFFGLALLMALPLLVWAYTYEALAFFGAAATALVVGLTLPTTGFTVLGFLIAGAVLLGVGAVESVRAYRTLDDVGSVGSPT